MIFTFNNHSPFTHDDVEKCNTMFLFKHNINLDIVLLLLLLLFYYYVLIIHGPLKEGLQGYRIWTTDLYIKALQQLRTSYKFSAEVVLFLRA
jgi:hypothetical protein